MNTLPDPDGVSHFIAGEHLQLERALGGFIVQADGYNNWMPDVRVVRARFEFEK